MELYNLTKEMNWNKLRLNIFYRNFNKLLYNCALAMLLYNLHFMVNFSLRPQTDFRFVRLLHAAEAYRNRRKSICGHRIGKNLHVFIYFYFNSEIFLERYWLPFF